MLEVAKEAALAAGAVLRSHAERTLRFEEKADRTLVSEADEAAERAAVRVIREHFADHTIVGEEGGRHGDGAIVWHVDPLDGTSNFRDRLPFYCVSIGVEVEGELQIGVIYNPVADALMSAERGGGAWLGGAALRVNARGLKGLHVIDASFGGERVEQKKRYVDALLTRATRIRMTGSNALQLAGVARGMFVSSLSDVVQSYDFAAGVVLVREAGGIVTDEHGSAPTTDSKVILAAASEDVHELLLDCAAAYRLTR